ALPRAPPRVPRRARRAGLIVRGREVPGRSARAYHRAGDPGRFHDRGSLRPASATPAETRGGAAGRAAPAPRPPPWRPAGGRAGAVVGGTNAGIHVLLWLPDVLSAEMPALVDRAAAAGVGVYPLTPFYITPPRRGGLVLAYAAMTQEDIRSGIGRLAACLPRS